MLVFIALLNNDDDNDDEKKCIKKDIKQQL